MVNPAQSLIAIRSCQAQDYRSEKIRWEQLGDKQCCEFYSKCFVKSLKNICINLHEEKKYRIIGQFIATENIVIFCMHDSKAVKTYDK